MAFDALALLYVSDSCWSSLESSSLEQIIFSVLLEALEQSKLGLIFVTGVVAVSGATVRGGVGIDEVVGAGTGTVAGVGVGSGAGVGAGAGSGAGAGIGVIAVEEVDAGVEVKFDLQLSTWYLELFFQYNSIISLLFHGLLSALSVL